MTVYAAPGKPGSLATFRPRYDHWIGGEYVAPIAGRYFENPTPVTGQIFCEVARGDSDDIEAALDAGDVLEHRVDEALTESADVGRTHAIDVRGVQTLAPEAAAHLEHDRRLADPPRTRDEDVAAIRHPRRPPPGVSPPAAGVARRARARQRGRRPAKRGRRRGRPAPGPGAGPGVRPGSVCASAIGAS